MTLCIFHNWMFRNSNSDEYEHNHVKVIQKWMFCAIHILLILNKLLLSKSLLFVQSIFRWLSILWHLIMPDVSCCLELSYDVSWHLSMFHDVLWHLSMSHDVSWCLSMSHDVSWFLWCLSMSHDVSWCLSMSHDKLSVASQLASA